MSSKFGNIAKVYVTKDAFSNVIGFNNELNQWMGGVLEPLFNSGVQAADTLALGIQHLTDMVAHWQDGDELNVQDIQLLGVSGGHIQSVVSGLESMINQEVVFPLNNVDVVPSVNIYILSYDKQKNLSGNAKAISSNTNDGIPEILKQNMSTYLSNYRMLTDEISIQDGYIINFGVFFDVVAHKYANKEKTKILCIQKIQDYFKIEKMQFNQPLFISQLEYELMEIDGVRAVNYVRLSQQENIDPISGESETEVLKNPTYRYSVNEEGDINANGTPGYGYFYNFVEAYRGGVILPANPQTPAVFELKHPNQNIVGRVR